MKITRTFGAIATACLLASGVQAGTVLQLDVNSLTVDAASAGFSDTFTGALSLNDDVSSSLLDLLIDGSAQNIASGQLADFTGSITLVGGTVTGGSFSITDTSGNIYSASISNGSGSVIDLTFSGEPGRFLISGLTFAGTFNTSVFAGVDVSTWVAGQPLSGSFLQFKFTPDNLGVDTDTDIDVFVMVPLPGSASLGLLGLGLLGATSRRRC